MNGRLSHFGPAVYMKFREVGGDGFRNSPWPKGSAIKAGIVNHDGHAVCGETNISLYAVSSPTESQVEGWQRVLGGFAGPASMCDE
jgi:hypothetical protein